VGGTSTPHLADEYIRLVPGSNTYSSQHLKTHSKPFKCEHCEKAFALRSDLARHVSTRHRVGQPEFRCTFKRCDTPFKRKDNLLQHMRDVHGKQNREADLVSRVQLKVPNSGTQEAIVESSMEEETYNYQVSPTTILQAASAGNIALLESAWSCGASLDMTGDDGSTALHSAARAGRATAVKRLLELRCSPTVTNRWMRTPLHEAILGQDLETVAAFLQERMYTVDTQTLHITIQNFKPDITRSILEHFELGQNKFTARTVLHFAAKFGRAEIVEDLMANSILHVNELLHQGYRALHTAAKHGHNEVVQKLLLQEDVKVNVVTSKRRHTPLHMAANHGHEEVVKTLLAVDHLEIDNKDSGLDAALHCAIQKGHSSIALLLLRDRRHAVACQNSQNMYSSRAFTQAVMMRCTSVASVLLTDPSIDINRMYHLRPDGSFRPLHAAARSNDLVIIKSLLVRKDLEPNARLVNGETPLHCAIKSGHIEATKLLLQHKNTNPNLSDDWGNIPLHSAMLGNCIDIVKLLLQHKDINPNLQDKDGNTPLHCALLWDRIEVAKLLLAHGRLDISKGEPSRAPFAWLISKKWPDETVLEIATRRDQTEIVEILSTRGGVRLQQATSAQACSASGQPDLASFDLDHMLKP